MDRGPTNTVFRSPIRGLTYMGVVSPGDVLEVLSASAPGSCAALLNDLSLAEAFKVFKGRHVGATNFGRGLTEVGKAEVKARIDQTKNEYLVSRTGRPPGSALQQRQGP